MELGLGCYLKKEQLHYLNYEQNLGLKQMFLLEQKLKHPEYPNSARGLEGMKLAHQILQERKTSGILIGGLSEAVWSQKRKEEDLYKHKDVDVLILNYSVEKFEGGIDWWLPNEGRITLSSDVVRSKGADAKWYKNGNDVILSFGVEERNQLAPGLYIPDREWVIEMREAEAEANVDYSRIDASFDDEVFKKFRTHIERRVKTRLPKFILETFKDFILSLDYESDWRKVKSIEIERFDIERIVGINKLEGIVESPSN